MYAIEASVGDWVRAVAAANGVADRLSVIDGWSTTVELPERADVFVSEMIGNEPFEEGMLEVVLDARERMLEPDARIIPRNVELLVVPVSVPPGNRLNRTIDHQRVDRWGERYGVDLSPLVELTAENRAIAMISAADARGLRGLAPPSVMADIDLATVREPSIVSTAVTEVVAEASRWRHRLVLTRARARPSPRASVGQSGYGSLELALPVVVAAAPSGASGQSASADVPPPHRRRSNSRAGHRRHRVTLPWVAAMGVADLGQRAKTASRALAGASTEAKDGGLAVAADLLLERADEILVGNAADVTRAEADGVSATVVDRLRLSATPSMRRVQRLLF